MSTNRIRQLIVIGDALSWVGTYSGGLYRILNGRWEKVGMPYIGDYVLSLKLDPYGGLWVGTARNGAYRFFNNAWTHIDVSECLADNNVWEIFLSDTNKIWFCSRYRGIYLKETDRCSCITTRQGLSDREMTCAAQDSTGTIWFGTARGGVCGFKDGTWTFINRRTGIGGNYIRALVCDSTLRWIGSWDAGLEYFNGASWKRCVEIKPPVTIISIDKRNTLWVGTWGNGVYRKDVSGWTHILSGKNGLSDNYVIDIKFDSENRIYFATSGGVAVWRNE
jgi:ligand-binding sensor domain-containing protein